MQIVLVEPLTIAESRLQEFREKVEAQGHAFRAYDTKPTSESDWLERCQGAEMVIVANSKMPASVLDDPALKYINVAFTGLDHIPMEKAEEKGIRVTNAAGYSDEGVAELVIGLTIGLLRQVKTADLAVRQGGRAADFLGQEIAGRTVGIIGTGHIGQRVAQVFHAMGAKLLGNNRSEKEEMKALGMTYVTKDELLAQSDIVTVHLPNTKETVDYLSGDDFSKMKKTAILINCARGPIVNSADLTQALKDGLLAGAGVDVYNQEPPLTDEPLLDAPNTILMPHVAYFTEEAMIKRAKIVFQNALNYLEGK